MELITTSPQSKTASSATITSGLLGAGVLIAPFFFAVAIAQALTRPGFDIRHLAVSALTLGDLGWIQSANFEITSLLMIACAVGVRGTLRGRRGGTSAPILLGLAGLGTLVAGIFHPDPALGFPPGTPAGMPATMSGAAMVHQFASMVTFGCTIATCFVLAWKFSGDRRGGWMTFCLASGIVAPILLVLAMSDKDWVGILLASMVAVAFGCISAAAARLRSGTWPAQP